MKTTINSRFAEIIQKLYNGNKRAFAHAIDVSATVIENVVGTRQGKPSYDVIEKVCVNANILPEWLLTGNGPMLRDGGFQSSEDISPLDAIKNLNTGIDNLEEEIFNLIRKNKGIEQVASTESPSTIRETLYKDLLVKQKADHKRELADLKADYEQKIAFRDSEIKMLNREIGAIEEKLRTRTKHATVDSMGLDSAPVVDSPSTTGTRHHK